MIGNSVGAVYEGVNESKDRGKAWRIVKALAPPCEALKEGWPRIKKKKRYLLTARTGWFSMVCAPLKDHPVCAAKVAFLFWWRSHPCYVEIVKEERSPNG